MSKKLTALLIALGFLAAGLLLPTDGSSRSPVFHQHEIWPPQSEKTVGMDQGVLSTHLPIIIIHADGNVIPGAEKDGHYDSERKLICRYSVIHNENGINLSTDPPETSGLTAISVRGNSSRRFRKKQFSMKLLDENRASENVPLLGMPAESGWILNGSLIDHSQLRNYMLYNISAEIMGYAPRCRLCEVMITNADGIPTYRGVYTLMEKIKVSPERLNLTPYDPKYAETSFLLQLNSQIDHDKISHLKPDEIPSFYFDLEYPASEEITPESLRYIQNEVLTFEKMLYDASHTEDWSRVNEVIDLSSFIDYYIINEFFQNYDAGTRSTYLYRNLGGKFSIGPVWDFDGTFNNFRSVNMKLDYLGMKFTYFYYFLTQDPLFAKRCAERYTELRRTVLSEQSLLRYLEDAGNYLGDAALRNCDRWYDGDYSCYYDDIKQMKKFIMARGAWMDEHFSADSGIIH